MSLLDPVDEAGKESFPASDPPAWPQPDNLQPFSLPALPYDYGDLESVIDTETMELHHDKHHRAYVNGLNAALSEHTEWQRFSIEEILRRQRELPSDIQRSVHDMGGGHYNHSLFWNSITPAGRQEPGGEMRRALQANFGSFDRFREIFQAAGMRQFGSGWVALVADPDRDFGLEIVRLPNQDTPLDIGRVALLACDLWEHAYYLNYRNRRLDWLRAWWEIVDWNQAATRLDNARSSWQGTEISPESP